MDLETKKSPDELLAGKSGLGDYKRDACITNYSIGGTDFEGQKTPQKSTPLGNTSNNVSVSTRVEIKTDKWRLLKKVQDQLEGTSFAVLDCQKSIGQVQVLKGDKGEYFGGVISCKSVWLCPVCNRRIAAERGEMIRQSASAGFDMLMLTLTLQHAKTDTLADVLSALKAAARELKSGRFWQDLKQDHDIKAYVTSYEITYGQNGWHPHVHMLLYFGHPPDIDALWADLIFRWVHVVERVGRYASKYHALDLEQADPESASDYLTKFRGGISYEMTGQSNKGRTFWDLVEQGKTRLVREYASATFGLKSLTWSHGAKKVLGIKDPDPDQNTPEVLCDIPDDKWEIIRQKSMQGFVLELAKIDPRRLQGFVNSIRDDDPKNN